MVRRIACEIAFALQLAAAGVGAVLYIASFFGRGIEDGMPFLIPTFVCLGIASIPRQIRDRRFFLRYWDLGLIGTSIVFRFDFFPARREKWLNPLALCGIAISFFHFWFILSSRTESQAGSAGLRYTSLIVICVAILSALAWMYPPTEKPDEESR